jgi:hypothetical protein
MGCHFSSDMPVAVSQSSIDKVVSGRTFFGEFKAVYYRSPMSTCSRQSIATNWILGIVGAAILYLLSGPPLFILAMRGYLPPQGVEFVRQFTRPFVWARDDSPLSNVLKDYSTWWWSIAGPP